MGWSMRYLKTYEMADLGDIYLRTYTKVFESVKQDLEDILLDINDDSNWKSICWSEPKNVPKLWVFIIELSHREEHANWSELEGQKMPQSFIETFERIIHFMKIEGFIYHRITLEVNDDYNELISEVVLDEICDLDFYSDSFIRIEFTR